MTAEDKKQQTRGTWNECKKTVTTKGGNIATLFHHLQLKHVVEYEVMGRHEKGGVFQSSSNFTQDSKFPKMPECPHWAHKFPQLSVQDANSD